METVTIKDKDCKISFESIIGWLELFTVDNIGTDCSQMDVTCADWALRYLKTFSEALREIAVEELDEGDSIVDAPTFGAQYYIGIARKALEKTK